MTSSSVGKESTCNAGDPGSTPGLGKSPGEGIGCPLQYSWASLVAPTVKNPPAMWETWVWSLDWEDSLQEGMATHSSILTWRIPWAEEPGGLQSTGSQRVRGDRATQHSTAQEVLSCSTALSHRCFWCYRFWPQMPLQETNLWVFPHIRCFLIYYLT